ncbi:carboxynorspermidine decarboxylase [Verrucomicrobiaceae bacterium N1E253]|uniref:Carboxynorspermidine/carboxyspermidine decarboxylase n=1 Tax=Oceaniferula marina TaxID=2748318 RepID=A0A851GFW8_9BACT|nr:carboxynorspermidine decarboxylase [Oceaniferula marina]NWK54165.1 carboxynorspermidine decarboxylase [Oceaniferula marina]
MSHSILEISQRDEVPTPCYLMDESLLARNLKILDHVQQESGGKIILALKGFAMWSTFPQISQTLCGTTASSLSEARLGMEKFGGEVHAYCVAYRDPEMDFLRKHCHHITLNSLSQWQRFQHHVNQPETTASFGLRINPEYSEVETDIYNPCRKGSRFGITATDLANADASILEGIDGLHFHTMCEQNSDTLERTLEHVEAKFGTYLQTMKWLNCGGGHHITRPDYDTDRLVRLIQHLRAAYDLEVYLEPGEAVALNTGFLITRVIDRFNSDGHPIAILDTSAAAHMPDVLEMPYRPEILGASDPGEKKHTITLGGTTCLAGDVIGDWSFDEDLKVGDRLVFTDMAHYSMVKTNHFNGVDHPAIGRYHHQTDEVIIDRQFTYEDYRDRLS